MKLGTHILWNDQFLLQQFLLILCCVVDCASVLIDIFVFTRIRPVRFITFEVILGVLFLFVFHSLLVKLSLEFLLVLFLLFQLFLFLLNFFFDFGWILNFLTLLLQEISIIFVFTWAVFIFFLLSWLILEPLTWGLLVGFLFIIAALFFRVLRVWWTLLFFLIDEKKLLQQHGVDPIFVERIIGKLGLHIVCDQLHY